MPNFIVRPPIVTPRPITPTTTDALQPIDVNKATSDPRGTLADVIRSQWANFQSSALPLVRGLEKTTTYNGNSGVVGGLVADARANAQDSFGSIAGDTERSARSYGMATDPTTQGAIARSARLGMAAATADGVNRSNTYQQDLNRQIVAGQGLGGGLKV